MILRVSVIVCLIITVTSQSKEKTLKSRKRRFVDFMNFWSGDPSEEYAVPEKFVHFAKPFSPYDANNKYDYLGRPSHFMAKLLKWDMKYEELGPTVSRLLGLARDLLEHSDVIQSIVAKQLGAEGKVYGAAGNSVRT